MLALLLTLGLAGLPGGAFRAATLGDMAVLSEFGEPLRAEIEISDLSAADAEALDAAIGSRADYASLGLRYPEALRDALVRVQRRPGGRVTVRVATRAPIADSEFNMVLALTTRAGRVLRNYQLISNPPAAGTAPTAPAAGAPPAGAPTAAAGSPPDDAPLRLDLVPVVPRAEPAAAAEPARAAAPPTPAAAASPFVPPVPPAAAPAASSAAAREPATASGRTVTVQRGETASAIARRFKPVDIDESQAVMALYRRNQAAFGGSVHKLPAGVQLTVPDEAEMRQQPRHEARAAIRGRDEPAAPRAGRPDRLVISGDAAAPTDGRGRLGSESSATRSAALDAAKAESDSRIRDLQKNLDDLNRMLELRDRQLAKLQDSARRVSDERSGASAAPMPVAATGSAPTDASRAAAEPVRVPEPAPAAPSPNLRPVPVPEAAPASTDWFSDWRIQAGAGVLAAVLVLAGVAITLRVSRPGASRGLTGGMRDWRDPAGSGRAAARRS